MSIAGKFKNLIFEEEPTKEDRSTPSAPTRPVAPLMSRTIPVADGLTLDQGIAVEMRNRLGQRRKTAAGWEKIQALKAACATLAKYVPDKTAQVRAALETQGLDVNALLECYANVLTVLANEDVSFQKTLEQEQSTCKPQQDKDIEGAKVQLAAAKQRVSDLNDQVEQLRSHALASQDRWSAAQIAFASALADIRKETNDELEQLKSLK